MRRAFALLILALVVGCASEDGGADDSVAGGGGSAAGGSGGQGAGGGAGATSGGAAGAGGSAGASGAGGVAGAAGAGAGPGDAGPGDAGADAPPPVCKCLLGEGPYCGARAAAEAKQKGCVIPALEGHAGDLLKCENDKWSLLEDCKGSCKFTAASAKLDDHCELPVCDCFVQVAWCGSGAAKEAEKKGCQIPILPEHNGDILYCPGGKWAVKQDCPLGCIEAPTGTPDSCKSSSSYKLPFDCGSTRSCTNGNHTNTHTGKDAYAYDFGMPIGTSVRAMRSGVVLRTRYPSPPGSPCYNAIGKSSCANYANTVEVKHSDGTVGLYMHLSSIAVKTGQAVSQGDVLGKSGNSGWSFGPHLHVQVQQNCGIWWCQSIPFKVAEDSTISAGTAVKSQNCP